MASAAQRMHLLLHLSLLLPLLLPLLLGSATGLALKFHRLLDQGRSGKKGLEPRRRLLLHRARNLPAPLPDDDAFFKECLFDPKIPLPVRKFLLALKSEKDALKSEKDVLKSEKDAAVAEKELVKEKLTAERNVAVANNKCEVMNLESSIRELMDSSSALNPRAVLEYVEIKYMPPEYAKLPRQVKWARFLDETVDGTALFKCLKKIPDWDSEKKIAVHLSNVYSLASQFAHCTSSSIEADPKVPIRISGPLLPQTLRAMHCIGKSFGLQFEDGAEAARGQADPQDAAGEVQG